MATVKEYATLSNEVYEGGGGSPGGDWIPWLRSDDPTVNVGSNTGYYAVAYLNTVTREIVIAHRGTELLKFDTGDLRSDWQTLLGNAPAQIADAQTFYAAVQREIATDPTLTGAVISHTGHSLGGAIARYLAADHGQQGVTFNAPGIAGAVQLPPDADLSRIYAYNAWYDAVSTYGTQVGTVRNFFVSSYAGVPDKVEVLVPFLAARFGLGWVAFPHFGYTQHSMESLLEVITATSGVSTFDPAMVGLQISPDYQVSGAWINEWSGLEEAFQMDAVLGPAGPLPEDDSTSSEIRSEQNTNLSARQSFDGAGSGTLIVGENGDDTLRGDIGADILFGDGGDDSLDGEAGNDYLVGGAGDDRLIGGMGDDYLNGGAGNDIYILRPGDGTDTIVDQDGKGAIVYDPDGTPQLLAVGTRQADASGSYSGAWQSLDGTITYTLNATDLLITTPGGSITVRNFNRATNDLGIRLIDLPADPPANLPPMAPASGAAESFIGTEEGNSANGEGGGDYMDGNGGDDYLMAGSRDADPSQMVGSSDDSGDPAGSARINGGNGRDVVNGHISDDHLIGGDNEPPAFPGDPNVDTQDALSGGLGNDYLEGGYGNDVLMGGRGHDVLRGGEGNDHLYGAADLYVDLFHRHTWSARDPATLAGDYNNIFFGFLGYSAFDVDGLSDAMYGEEGYDMLVGGAGDDYLDGGEDNDELYGNDGNDMLIGGDGLLDMLAGNEGDDVLLGGAGNDQLFGDRNMIGTPVGPGINGKDYLDGGTGDDLLMGDGGDDLLIGGTGNDYLEGGLDNDTYLFARGDGLDTLLEYQGNDTLQLTDIRASDATLAFVSTSTDLIVQVNGTSDRITLLNWMSPANRLDTIQFADGTVWDERQILENSNLATSTNPFNIFGTTANDLLMTGAGNDWLEADSGNDELIAGAGDDTLLGDEGDDRLFGGLGSDTLVGNADADLLDGGIGNDRLFREGNDRLVFRAGDGQDTVYLGDGQGTLAFEGVNVSDVKLSAVTGTDNRQYLKIDYGQNDSVSLEWGFLAPNQRWEFNGQSYTHAEFMRLAPQLNVLPLNIGGTTAAEVIYGSDRPVIQGNRETINGGGGDDTVYGQGGDDIVDGGAGNDTVNGGAGDDLLRGDDFSGVAGNDTLRGDTGDDRLFGYGGADVLDGGTGKDYLAGDRGDDVYLFGRGSGADELSDYDGLTGGLDTVQLDAGILPADVTLHRNGWDLILALDQSPTQLTMLNGADPNYRVERISFADGTVWNAADIEARIPLTSVDNFVGTTGNDTFIVDNTQDTVTEQPDQGIDAIQSGVTYTLPTNVENLTLTGFINVKGTGNDLNNTILGNSGNNTLEGAGGVNVLRGGAGDDQYVLRRPSTGIVLPFDTVNENPGEGIDTVLLGVNAGEGMYLTPDYVENVEAYAYLSANAGIGAVGNALDNVMRGAVGGVNELNGGAGNDTLFGGDRNDQLDGGTGVDTMFGGWGDDTYWVDDPSDQIVDVQGIDTVKVVGNVSGTYTLSRFAFVENLDLSAAVGAVDLVGDAANNLLIGNIDVNRLTGGGGNDVLIGYAGNDTLVGDAGDDILYGDEGGDTLEGGAGNDTLDGGLGSDTLSGGAGDDIYLLNNLADVVIENAAEGIDTVRISDILETSSYSLSAFANVENLDVSGGYAAVVIGNGGDNILTAGSDANMLDGAAGNDQIYGGAGNDTLLGGEGDDIIYGGDGNDVYDGGAGNDLYVDTIGSDIYIFGRGLGQDVIADTDNGLFTDVIRFTSEISPADIALGRSQNDLVVTISGASDTLTVKNYFFSTFSEIERLEFSGGTYWNVAAITSRFTSNNSNMPTEAADTIAGSSAGDVLSGLGGDDTLSGEAGDDTLDGGAGNDTVFGNAGNDVLQGGLGDDQLWGHDGNDTLLGGEGNDVLFGATGDDILDGGAGNDLLGTYSSDGLGNDTYRFARGGGQDQIIDSDATIGNLDTIEMAAGILPGDVTVTRDSDDLVLGIVGTTDAIRVTWFYSAANEIERLTFTDGTTWDAATLKNMASAITGTAGADTLTGTNSDDQMFGLAGNDTLTGNAGNDLLDGGTGADSMTGGSGNDTYIVDNTSDTVTESSGGGTDTILSSVTRTLGSNQENLTLTGTNTINGTGNTLNNVITGNAANNTLSGGTGADSLIGGLGNDTYTVDNVGDIVTENVNEGTDLVNSSVTYTLGNNVENLTLTGTGTIHGTGNNLDNVLTGNSANNTLTGGAGNDTLNGGTGTDTMIGGLGNDTYVVNVSTDITTENASEGTDTIQSNITLSLATRNHVENLTLTGTTAINGTGNSLDNVINGNSAVNTLTGDAGNDTLDGAAGNDILRGGLGDDTYIFGTGDTLTENANEGTDTVRSTITHTLGANLENLVLTGTSVINGTGNALNNVLTGNSANNTLTGNAGNDTLNGGTGTDTLNGGTGNDTYVFNRTYGLDSITDSDATPGNQDTVLFGVNPLDLVFVRNGNNLDMRLHGSPDTLTVNSWYTGTTNQTEILKAQNGSTLVNTQVDQLIQAMAQFSANNGGITWDQAIDQNPTEVQNIVASYWQGA